MAINTSIYSGKEFSVYIGADATVGTKNASTDGANMYRLDVEGITLPGFSPNQEFEMRSGSGRVAEFGQVFSSTKRVVTEVSLSGRVELQSLPILYENVFSQAATGNDNNFKIATGYTPGVFEHGTAAATTVFDKTLTLFFLAPTAADSITLPGCVCTSLALTADMTSNSGRYDYTATFQTMYQPAKGTDSMSDANELTTTLGSTNMYLSDQTTKDFDIIDYNTSDHAVDSINPVINTLTLTVESPTQFLGAQGTSAEPEGFARAVPELSITLASSFKYDTGTDKLTEAFRDTGEDSFVRMILNNKAVTSVLESPDANLIPLSSAQTFGFIIPKAKLTSCEVSSDDVAMVSFEAKVLDPGSNFVLHLATGATA
jgi:hypothetical protein